MSGRHKPILALAGNVKSLTYGPGSSMCTYLFTVFLLRITRVWLAPPPCGSNTPNDVTTGVTGYMYKALSGGNGFADRENACSNLNMGMAEINNQQEFSDFESNAFSGGT